MNIEINRKYFIIVSGRESLKKAIEKEDIKSVISDETPIMYKNGSDNSSWIDRFSGYDYIHEFSGIMRLPEPSFIELWALLQYSNIESNRIGALLIIEELYGKELLEQLVIIQNSKKVERHYRRALKLLKEYSLPNGAFHWVQNKNLNESQKYILRQTWDSIGIIVNDLLS